MKSIIEFITDKSSALLNEKQNFLVKGHTKSQKEKIVTDKNIKALDKAFTTFCEDIQITIDYPFRKEWNEYEYKQKMLNACLDILLATNKSKRIGQIVWAISRNNEYHVRVYDNSGKIQPKFWLTYDNGTVTLKLPGTKITDRQKIIVFINNLL